MKISKIKNLILSSGLAALPLFLVSGATAWAAQNVPEIPASAAPFLLAGATGIALWVQRRFRSPK